jgi:ATP-dependent Clp protease ATP-binding subunit ClpC
VNITVPVYQRKVGTSFEWTTLGLREHTARRSGPHPPKLEQSLIDELRKKVETLTPGERVPFELKRGTRLERVRLELVLKGGEKKRKSSGLFPLVIEPHLASENEPFVIAYHPARQAEWFPVREEDVLAERAAAYFALAWADLDDEAVLRLTSDGRDSIKVLAFSGKARTVLDQLSHRKKGIWEDLETEASRRAKGQPGALKVLSRVAVDLTARLAPTGPAGVPRSPYREQLQGFLGSGHRRPTLVVGAPGVGKTTLLRQWIGDLLALEDYASHRNLDRVHHVWQTSGRQLVAGMTHLGEWEQRCVDLLEDVRPRKVVLLVTDLHLWGRLGRTRDSERCLADVFRGPLLRGEVVLMGECTPTQLRRLEEDAPSFAPLFTRLRVHPASDDESFRILVHEARILEADHRVEFDPYAFRTTLELCRTVLSARGLPGSALDVVRRLAAEREGGPPRIGPDDVLAHVSARSGIPRLLLERERALPLAEVEEAFARHVLGQPEAVRAASDLVLRIRERLVDPRRPYGVYLFTGPTGTGKTELAKAIAEYLYGAASRLLRLDMSEYSASDAVSRLIGDSWSPEGILTRAALEQPFSVVLFDEIEKAHPSVHNLLLQLFDEGRLTDASGTTVSFQHTVVILTSNLGSKAQPAVGFGASPDAVLREVARAVREFFSPELFNRIDHVVPFGPLTEDVATGVVKKELAKLLGRSGLTARNIFVRTTVGVVDHVRREAFRAEDGARSLKRYLEDAIGSRLSEEIVRAPAAAMRVMTLYEANGALHVLQDRLVEARQVPARFALDALLDRPALELRAELPSLLPVLDAIEASGDLEQLSERIRFHLGEHSQGRSEHGSLIYNLDWMRAHAAGLREQVERLGAPPSSQEYEAIERARFGHVVYEPHDRKPSGRYRLFARGDGNDDRVASRRELLSSFAEVHFLRRALSRAHDPNQHAVFLELARVGAEARRRIGERDRGGDALLPWLARAYIVARGEVDAFAMVLADGEVREGEGRAGLEALLANGTGHLVVKLVGPCVREFFELEAGTHIWQSLASAPEIVRVRVLPVSHGATPGGFVRSHQMELRAFEEDATRGDPLALSPIARVLRFDPPRPDGPPARLEMEDFVIGYTGVAHARSISEALQPLWLLRLSREDAQ